MKIVILFIIFNLYNSSFAQTEYSYVTWILSASSAEKFVKINKLNDPSDSVIKSITQNYDDNIVDDYMDNPFDLKDYAENKAVILGFKNSKNEFIKLSEVGINSDSNKIIFGEVTNSNKDEELFQYKINAQNYNYYFAVIYYSTTNNKNNYEILKSKSNGTRLYVEIPLKRMEPNNKRYFKLFRKVDSYSQFGIANTVGFWLPVGLFSLGKEDGNTLLTAAPISIALGTKINQTSNPDDYLGISAFINYSLTESQDKKFVNALSVGPILDIYNYIYFGWNFNIQVASDNTSKSGFLFGVGPRTLNLVKGILN